MDRSGRDECLVWTCAVQDAAAWGIDSGAVAGRGGLSLLGDTMLTVVVAWAVGLEPCAVRMERICPRCGGQHGKPQAPGGLQISASHTVGLVAVALTRVGRVGIDLERVASAPPWGVLRGCHALGEPLPRSAPEFYRWWTRKESVLKATGEGLHRDPVEVVVAEKAGKPQLESYAGRPLVATMTDLSPSSDHVGCVTVLGRAGVDVRSGPPGAELVRRVG